MAELTFPVSPGVVTREIDLSGPTQTLPTGIPAGIVGTAVRGPAFVPVTVATFQDFISVFGNSDGEKFGPIAMREWLRNANAGTYVRVLGVGDGQARQTAGTNLGRVQNSGFVVGNRLPQESGLMGDNTFAGSSVTGYLGKTHVLAVFMSESAGSTVFSSAGIQSQDADLGGDGAAARPIIRGILLAPSGVNLGLSSSLEDNNATQINLAASGVFGPFADDEDAGCNIGSVDLSNSQSKFVMLINGLKNSKQYKNILTASFDTESPSYFVNVFNTDPTKIEAAGHYLYAHWDIHSKLAVVTGSGVVPESPNSNNVWETEGEPVALLLTSSLGRNTGNATSASGDTIGIPNFENFEDRYNAAFSPWVISQKFGQTTGKNLFKFHTLTDGAVGSGEFKITIENVAASSKSGNKFGTFDVLIRRFMDNDITPQVLESYRGCDLNVSSDNYIAKRIGDTNTYFDFDAAQGSQKVVVAGDYPNVSSFVRVEISDLLKNKNIDQTALPLGFRGPHHLVTSGSSATGGNASILTGSFSTLAAASKADISSDELGRVVQLPIPMRETIAVGVSPKKSVKNALTWGVQFENKTSATETNKNENLDNSLLSFARQFSTFFTAFQNPWVGDNAGTADVGGCVLDSDRFNNNMFTLERVQVITGSNNRPDTAQWSSAVYRRTGIASGSLDDRDGNAVDRVRFLDPSLDFTHVPSRKFYKFTFPMLGGFDGLNILDKQKAMMSDAAARREMTDTSGQAGKNDSTVAGFRKAIDLMEAKQDVDIQLLAIPGMRHPSITDYAIESTERRFDALYVLDIEEKDEIDAFITSSLQVPNVTNTINRFSGRSLDTSFAAAYFPDVVITDPATRTNVKTPPSAMMMGAMALNDALAHPWFAPAGFTRGVLATAIYPGVELLQSNRDDLYTADINPIIGDVTSTGGVTVFGQKTLLAAQSSLDRVNVRRLLIDIRRKVRNVARTFLFEPNQASTIAAFNARVMPILAAVQSQGGLDRFKVQIDTTTTTQADVENNTIRGRIFLQPTRSVEFVSLDFVVSNNI